MINSGSTQIKTRKEKIGIYTNKTKRINLESILIKNND